MIVIARNYGQLGNRLFLYAHLIAAAREYQTVVANPCFAEYAELFSSTARDLWCRHPLPAQQHQHDHYSPRLRHALATGVYLCSTTLARSGLTRWPAAVIRLRGEQSIDLAGPEFRDRVASNSVVLVQGWLFRSQTLFDLHADAIRDHFQIRACHQRAVNEAIGSARRDGAIVVGVHVRRGDYASYLDGRYYYSLDQYAAAMRQIAAQIPSRQVRFLVCSNEPIESGSFGGLEIQLGPGQLVEDMYALAATDLIIGPPSTFTGWASFYGQTPLIQLHAADQAIDLSGHQPDLYRRLAA